MPRLRSALRRYWEDQYLRCDLAGQDLNRFFASQGDRASRLREDVLRYLSSETERPAKLGRDLSAYSRHIDQQLEYTKEYVRDHAVRP
jgi:hypothetical protein